MSAPGWLSVSPQVSSCELAAVRPGRDVPGWLWVPLAGEVTVEFRFTMRLASAGSIRRDVPPPLSAQLWFERLGRCPSPG